LVCDYNIRGIFHKWAGGGEGGGAGVSDALGTAAIGVRNLTASNDI